jgi:hypothetical protein
MAGANSNIQVTDLDFNSIKNNLRTFLQSQPVLQDYNYEGSALSTLLDVLAYNTQYNAFYLNMVANEMFLDTALSRNSVVSQAKLLDYVPKSAIAPSATINLKVNQVTQSSLTLPKFTNLLSEAIDGVNYNFVTTDSYTVNVQNNTATFSNVIIKQGIPTTQSYLVDSTTNPNYVFTIPDVNIDTTTLVVSVQQSSTNSAYQVFTLAPSYLQLTGSDAVYFLQEGQNGNYQIYFGDGILGQQLVDGNIVGISYIVTAGPLATGANNFILLDSIAGYSNTSTFSVVATGQGGAKESISSIKFQAPKAFSSQNRAVTKEDYITLISQNNLGIKFDAVNVWGGQENNPPAYGQVYVALKPSGSYTLTDVQKQQIINEIITPISVMTVRPVIIDPDYTYIKVTANVRYDPKKTNYTSSQLQSLIVAAVNNFTSTTLNTFNSTFSSSALNTAIITADPSIVTVDFSIQVQKKFYPNLTTSTTYNFYFNTPLQRGILLSGINSSPAVQFRDPSNASNIIDGIYIEEIPVQSVGVDSLSIINPGFGYQYPPTVTISGDGTGATAEAILNGNGQIKSIVITNAGTGYTSALAVITNAANDTTGQLGAAVVKLQGQYGQLRSYYNNALNVKTIFNSNVGTVDYVNGVVTLNSFGPLDVDNPLGQLTITANPTTTIISSAFNRIITVDPFDPLSVVVNITT